MTSRAPNGRPAPAAVLALGVLALGTAGCRAHTQELVLNQAAQDFFEPKVLCSRFMSVGYETAGGVSLKEIPVAVSDASEAREQLVPWIVGPNRYVVEGCKHQARYTCTSERCKRDGNIQKLRAFVEIAPPPPGAKVASGDDGEAAPPAADSGAETDAVREALDARRGEIAACVDRLPVGLMVELNVGMTPAVSLRGALKGKPEEGCVRSALKDLKVPAVKAPFSVIHIVK